GGHSDNRAILLGAEFYGNLPIGGTYPINATWIVGLGAGFDDDITALRVPLGISVGTYLGQGAMRIQPYVHPRVAFDLVAIDTGDDEETETDFSFAIDIGADLDLSERWAVKAGYTFSFGPDFDTSFDFYGNTFGAGIVYRMPRRVRSNWVAIHQRAGAAAFFAVAPATIFPDCPVRVPDAGTALAHRSAPSFHSIRRCPCTRCARARSRRRRAGCHCHHRSRHDGWRCRRTRSPVHAGTCHPGHRSLDLARWQRGAHPRLLHRPAASERRRLLAPRRELATRAHAPDDQA